MAIGEKQKAQIVALKSQGMTQNEIADQLGISRSTVCRVLRGFSSLDDEDKDSLEQFRDQQRQFAVDFADWADELIKRGRQLGEDGLPQSARDVSVLAKSATLLFDASSNAWSQATGLERTLNELEQIAKERESGFTPSYTSAESASASKN